MVALRKSEIEELVLTSACRTHSEFSIRDIPISGEQLYCILHAPMVRLAAFRWPNGFPFYPILCDFKSLADV